MKVGSREPGVGTIPFSLSRREKRGQVLAPRSEGRLFLVSLLCLTLLLAGCAAGSPSIVAPAAPETSSQDLVPPVDAAVESSAPRSEARDIAAPETAAPSTDLQPAPVDTTSLAGSAAVESLAPSAAETLSATDTAAFAQDVPAETNPLSEPVLTTDEVADDVTAARASTRRPPPPPDPGTGLSAIVDRGTNGRLEVALTFDAGADTGYAAEILDLLQAEGISATFGMTGVWAQANPDLVQRMVAEGHQLMNHTWDHSSLTGANTQMPPMTPEQVAQQLADTEAVVRDLTDYEMRPYFRPPYGDYDAASLEYLYDNGYSQTIWWTCDSRGWAGWGAQEIIDYCTTNIAEDEILLLHVGAAAVGDFEALPGLIQFFRDTGYAFVTIEQMLQP